MGGGHGVVMICVLMTQCASRVSSCYATLMIGNRCGGLMDGTGRARGVWCVQRGRGGGDARNAQGDGMWRAKREAERARTKQGRRSVLVEAAAQ